MTSGIFLSASALQALAPDVRAAVIEAATGIPAGSVRTETAETEHYPDDLTPYLAGKLVAGCGDRTKQVLRVIAGGRRTFRWSDVANQVGSKPGDLRAVWGAITKRTRTVLGRDDAYLIHWEQDGQDWEGQVSPATHSALRKAFKIT